MKVRVRVRGGVGVRERPGLYFSTFQLTHCSEYGRLWYASEWKGEGKGEGEY